MSDFMDHRMSSKRQYPARSAHSGHPPRESPVKYADGVSCLVVFSGGVRIGRARLLPLEPERAKRTEVRFGNFTKSDEHLIELLVAEPAQPLKSHTVESFLQLLALFCPQSLNADGPLPLDQ